MALRRVADVLGVAYDPDPAPDDPIALRREEFDDACAHLAEVGIPIRVDRDATWQVFRGWRVNYEASLLGLAALLAPHTAPWSADRPPLDPNA